LNIRRIYNNKKQSKKFFKIFLLISILSIICLSCFYELYKYNKLIDTFKKNFDEYKFSDANNSLLTEQNLNIFKSLMINKDMSKYFNNKIDTLKEELLNKDVSSEDALMQLKEIQRYNIIENSILYDISSSIESIQDSIKNYNTGIEYFNNGQYSEAISYLKKVSTLDLNYTSSLIYLDNSKNKIKESLLDNCDALVLNDHYNEALSKISEDNDLLGNDVDVQNKILDIKTKQQEYLDKDSAIAEASSRALTNTISPNNINTLNIESTTSYLINVSLEKQTTYIYKGKADKWQLIKTFSCSTGVSGEDTPSGSFSTKERGEWFFSDKYEQGGKYWTQITGDILFHSVPFAKDKTTVLDYTMNKPSSHGCIRLSLDDAKWIYTNIPRGSKVLIK
jgi:lipoprotein-anchoring transpeptidase ErfK/SrfK